MSRLCSPLGLRRTLNKWPCWQWPVHQGMGRCEEHGWQELILEALELCAVVEMVRCLSSFSGWGDDLKAGLWKDKLVCVGETRSPLRDLFGYSGME